MNDDLVPLLREILDRQRSETFVDKVRNVLPLILAVASMFAFVWTLRSDAALIAAQVRQLEVRMDKMDADLRKHLDSLTGTLQNAHDAGIRLQERHTALQEETRRIRQSCCK